MIQMTELMMREAVDSIAMSNIVDQLMHVCTDHVSSS